MVTLFTQLKKVFLHEFVIVCQFTSHRMYVRWFNIQILLMKLPHIWTCTYKMTISLICMVCPLRDGKLKNRFALNASMVNNIRPVYLFSKSWIVPYYVSLNWICAGWNVRLDHRTIRNLFLYRAVLRCTHPCCVST